MKRSPLKRKTPLKRGMPFRQRKSGHDPRAYTEFRNEVRDATNGRCVGYGITDAAGAPICYPHPHDGHQAHHLLPRSAGGPDERSNGAWVCAKAHSWVHGHPAQAYERGMLRRRSYGAVP